MAGDEAGPIRRPNTRLRMQREGRGWSRPGLAQRLQDLAWQRDHRNVSPDKVMVAKWELGSRAVSPYYRVLLCVLFEMSAEALGLLEPDEESARWSPQERASSSSVLGRRTFVSLAGAASVAAAAAVSASGPQTSQAGSVSARPDQVRNDLHEITTRLRSLDGALGPGCILDQALAHQQLTIALLREAGRSQRRNILALEAADITGLIAWLSFDVGEYDASFAHYRAAATLAGEGDDPGFLAWVLGSEALVLNHLQNDRQALDVLQAAHDVASRTSSTVTSSWLAAIACHTNARLGDGHEAWRSYGMAERLLEASERDTCTSWMSFFHMAHVVSAGGRAYLALGQHRHALRELERALALHPPHLVRERSQFLCHLGEAHIAANELDAGCSFLGDAVEIASWTKSARIVQRVRSIRGSISPAYREDREVHSLDERLRAVAV